MVFTLAALTYDFYTHVNYWQGQSEQVVVVSGLFHIVEHVVVGFVLFSHCSHRLSIEVQIHLEELLKSRADYIKGVPAVHLLAGFL